MLLLEFMFTSKTVPQLHNQLGSLLVIVIGNLSTAISGVNVLIVSQALYRRSVYLSPSSLFFRTPYIACSICSFTYRNTIEINLLLTTIFLAVGKES